MLFQNSISSDQMLPLQLLSVYKPLLVDKPGSQELFSSQFLMKNSKKNLHRMPVHSKITPFIIMYF